MNIKPPSCIRLILLDKCSISYDKYGKRVREYSLKKIIKILKTILPQFLEIIFDIRHYIVISLKNYMKFYNINLLKNPKYYITGNFDKYFLSELKEINTIFKYEEILEWFH